MSESAAAKLAALSLHDALPIFALGARDRLVGAPAGIARGDGPLQAPPSTAEVVTGTQQLRVDEIRELDPDLIVATPTTDLVDVRSEEHTSELQSRLHLVCRLLLEKKHDTHS